MSLFTNDNLPEEPWPYGWRKQQTTGNLIKIYNQGAIVVINTKSEVLRLTIEEANELLDNEFLVEEAITAAKKARIDRQEKLDKIKALEALIAELKKELL